MFENNIEEQNQNKKKKFLEALSKILIGFLRILPSFLAALGIILIMIIISAAIFVLPYFSTFKTVYLDTHAAVENMKLAQTYIFNKQFDKAEAPLKESKQRFQNAQEQIARVDRYYRKVNYINQQLLGVDDLLEIGEQISDSLIEVSRLGAEFLEITQSPDISLSMLSRQQKHEILGTLKEAGPELEKIKNNLEIATTRLDEFNDRPIFPLIKKIAVPIQENLPKYEPIFTNIVVYGKLLPQIAGYEEQQNYLFLLENNDEMRPAGGFLGTYGVIQVKDTEFVDFFTDNIYKLDRPAEQYLKVPAPEPIKVGVIQEYWFMRDSNWWYDFPTSAEKVEWFYHEENGPIEQIDGVVAITQTFIEGLLGITGPIEVDDILFTQENFTDKLEYEVEKRYALIGIPEEERKEIIGDLATEIINRIFNLPRAEWEKLIDVVEKNIEEKHVMVYLKDPALQKEISQLGWTAEAYMGDADYLAVIDANLASLKTDAVVNKSYEYNIEETKDGLFAKVKLFYENTGTFTWKTTRYRTYNRIYAPINSQLISYKENNKVIDLSAVDNYQELDKQVFGRFIIIEPKHSKTVEITYKLPETIKNQLQQNKYTLVIQKQPGLDKAGLSVNMTFIKPFKAQSAILERLGQTVKWQGDLKKDMEFVVEF